MNISEYRFLGQISKLPFVDAIWLYGSRARGDYHERSDIDIAVVCPRATAADWSQIMEIVEHADTLLHVDCMRFDGLPENSGLRANILKQKQVFFERHSEYMEKQFWQDYFEELGHAVERLAEILADQNTRLDIRRDAAIQRFEFTVELFWKVLKKFLAYEKVAATTPRDVVQKAYQYSLIDNEEQWLSMLDDRNRTSHVYEEEEANRVFQNIKAYSSVLQATYARLRTKFYK